MALRGMLASLTTCVMSVGAVHIFADVVPKLADESRVQMPEVPVFIHHVRGRRAFQLLNKHLAQDMRDVNPQMRRSKRLFCWAWVRPKEDDDGPEEWCPELREMLSTSGCDGWALFSNFNDPANGITKAHDGPSGENAQSAIQFHSVYDTLVHDASMDSYDWFLELEADHFVRSSFLKMVLPDGDDVPIWSQWMNVHLFNGAWFKELKKKWPTLNKRREDGCPTYSPDDIYPNCQGDVSLPVMAKLVGGHTEYGSLINTTRPLQAGYYEMQDLGASTGYEWDTEAGALKILCELVEIDPKEPLCRPAAE